ncbi:zinc finger BED domain-containing protein RICESLEEPER 1-like [Asparagus officinalis]|uniref:zinc finger BED domain-containing protein RICESLEEPER 1-like n=1 Tax=Asparagus officinalis TaxID=4686 RepID=UPI00098E236A|nr:zinc finger BED domain-containing protein RICESLEEPER 1-like [Asparagus officinalis]XP_020251907.1 zinc finger BED domain-containing protein RICESLEEPER 1-like [Asparagus officinalis]
MHDSSEMDGNNGVGIAIAAPNPRARKLRSAVWNDFTKEKREDGAMVATCNHCKRQLTASSRSGTTHLKNHLAICTTTNVRRPDRRKRRKLVIRRPVQIAYGAQKDGAAELEGSHFDQDLSRQDLARMIILHEYPLSIVHHAGFRTFVRNLQPQFNLLSHETIKDDCMKIYDNLRLNLYEVLDKLPCRVSLTADTWRSGVSEEEEYLCLTCHYVDNDWKLQKKTINFLHFDAPSTGEEISKAIIEKLYEWKLTKKVATMILDSCNHTEEVTGEMLKFLRPKASLLLNGDLFHVHGYAHVLNLVVQDGLEVVCEVVDRVRDAIKHVKSSQESIRRFQKLARLVQAPQKPLILDVKGNWSSTYSMLATACGFEYAFERLAESDKEFADLLSSKDMDDVKAVCECMDVFYSAIEKFSGSRVPTANLFFNDACGIRLLLKDWSVNPLSVVATMASEMLDKFEQYWDVTGKVMAIASILDPRYKMKSIEYFFKLIYDGEYEAKTKIENIRKNLTSLYNEYLVRSAYTSNNQNLLCYDEGSSDRTNAAGFSISSFKTSSRITLSDTQRGLDQYLQQTSSSHSIKSDLDMYLEEPVHPSKEGLSDSFNVLAWWKFNEAKYPILSLVARDILAIPISAQLNVEGRSLNQYLSSMDAMTVQGLLCAQGWLRDEVADVNICGAGDMDSDICTVAITGKELSPGPQ